MFSGLSFRISAGGSVDLSEIPQAACCLTSRSPDLASWTSVFRPERRLYSRRSLELGGSGREPAALLAGGDVIQRGGQICPAVLVKLELGSQSRA